MIRKHFSALALAIAVFLGAGGAVQAAPITITSLGFGEYPVAMIVDGVAQNKRATQILGTLDGAAFVAYCVDLFTPISYSTYENETGAPSGYLNGGRVAWLYEFFNPPVDSPIEGAALQLAIWDVVHDGGDGLSAGRIQLNVTASFSLRILAELLVTASFGQSSSNATILYNTNIDSRLPAQTLIIGALSAGDIPEIPEPSTWAMAGTGLALLLASRVRRAAPARL